jgi:outer membrane lipoprotein-sorting protein
MSGSNTIKVWYGGPDRQRIAVLEATGETDLFRDGTSIWQWDSTSGEAVQSVASASAPVTAVTPLPVDGTTITPDDLARGAVAAIDPQTSVEVGAPGTVAGRSAYQLVLTPGSGSKSGIGRVVLWLDGSTRMPLAAQVYARGITREPSIDLAFTQIVLAVPDESAFQFVPPRTAHVTALNSGAALSLSPDPLLGVRETTTTGSGWTRVAVVSAPKTGGVSATADDIATAQFGDHAVAVSGAWGHGKLLQTNNGLLCMLFVSDGRIVVGSVDPAALYAALS